MLSCRSNPCRNFCESISQAEAVQAMPRSLQYASMIRYSSSPNSRPSFCSRCVVPQGLSRGPAISLCVHLVDRSLLELHRIATRKGRNIDELLRNIDVTIVVDADLGDYVRMHGPFPLSFTDTTGVLGLYAQHGHDRTRSELRSIGLSGSVRTRPSPERSDHCRTYTPARDLLSQ